MAAPKKRRFICLYTPNPYPERTPVYEHHVKAYSLEHARILWDDDEATYGEGYQLLTITEAR